MSVDKNPSKRTLYLCLLLVSLVFALRCVSVRYTGDGYNYLGFARGFAQGAGLVSQVVVVDSAVPRPLDLWPPLYPMLLGGALRLGLSPDGAAGLINLLSLFAASAAFFTMGQKATKTPEDREYHWVLLCLLVLSRPLAHIAGLALSEPLMIGLLAWALALDLNDRNDDPARAAAVGLLLGLSILTRYAAAFAVPAVMLGRMVSASLWPRRRARDLRQGGIAVAIATLTVLPWLARNYRLFGHLFGHPHVPRRDGAYGALLLVLARLEDLGSDATLGCLGIVAFVLSVYTLLLGPILWELGRRQDRRRGLTEGRQKEARIGPTTGRPYCCRALPLFLFPALYLPGLFALAFTLYFDEIGLRLLSPLCIGMLPLLAVALSRLCHELPATERRIASGTAVVLCGAVLLYPVERTLEPKVTLWHGEQLIAWVKEHATPSDLIIGRGAFFLGAYTEATVLSDGYPELGTISRETLSAFLLKHRGQWRGLYWIDRARAPEAPPLPETGFCAAPAFRSEEVTLWKLAIRDGDRPCP